LQQSVVSNTQQQMAIQQQMALNNSAAQQQHCQVAGPVAPPPQQQQLQYHTGVNHCHPGNLNNQNQSHHLGPGPGSRYGYQFSHNVVQNGQNHHPTLQQTQPHQPQNLVTNSTNSTNHNSGGGLNASHHPNSRWEHNRRGRKVVEK